MASLTAGSKQGSRTEVLRGTSCSLGRRGRWGWIVRSGGDCGKLESADLPKGAVLPDPGQMPAHTEAA